MNIAVATNPFRFPTRFPIGSDWLFRAHDDPMGSHRATNLGPVVPVNPLFRNADEGGYCCAADAGHPTTSSRSSALNADSSLSGIPSWLRLPAIPPSLSDPNRYRVGRPDSVVSAISATPFSMR